MSNSQTKFPDRLKVSIVVVLLSGVGIVGLGVAFLNIFPSSWLDGSLDAMGAEGPYTIEKVVLTNELDEAGRPVGSVDAFKPYEQIIGWVATQGAEGIIGMRWYYGDKLISEHFGKTKDNQVFTYVQSTADVTLPEGEYRLDIYISPNTPRESLHFTVEQYEPKVIPPQPTPTGHVDVENSAFVDVPFIFDEVWTIGETNWEINEVKVTFLGKEVFVAVAVDADLELTRLTEAEAFAITKPIAIYAVRNGYLEQAQNLQIDGKSYELDEIIYVNLINRNSADPFEQSGKAVYRTGFNIRDLVSPQG